jgi:dTDP-4-amino-4,6-dideoxygalactose transaminase
MVDRNHNDIWGVNYRLQPLQAIVASHVLDTVPEIIRIRTRNARLLDEGLKEMRPWVVTPPRPAGFQETYGLYMVLAKKRDALLRHLQRHGVEAKVHYPVPLHLQKAARVYGYRRGDCPKAEQQARELVSLPMHQFVSIRQIRYILKTIRNFYKN